MGVGELLEKKHSNLKSDSPDGPIYQEIKYLYT